eukprot:1318913-Amorphochlora_amoeboformis.AAC.1
MSVQFNKIPGISEALPVGTRAGARHQASSEVRRARRVPRTVRIFRIFAVNPDCQRSSPTDSSMENRQPSNVPRKFSKNPTKKWKLDDFEIGKPLG